MAEDREQRGQSSENPTDVAQLLRETSRGDPQAASYLADLLYVDLRREAERHFQRENAEHTLQPTALIHESFIRLIGQSETHWQNREHFLAVASTMMRRILTDYARARTRQKRGGRRQQLALSADKLVSTDDPDTVLAVHDALNTLEKLDPRQARIVELRFYAGMTNEEVAKAMGVSLRTVEAEWSMARAWLKRELSSNGH